MNVQLSVEEASPSPWESLLYIYIYIYIYITVEEALRVSLAVGALPEPGQARLRLGLRRRLRGLPHPRGDKIDNNKTIIKLQ